MDFIKALAEDKAKNNNNIRVKIDNKPELKEKLYNYLALTDYKKLSNYIEDLITQDLKNKIVTNKEIIKLDKAYYFNWHELLKNNKAKATTTPPASDINEYYIIKQVNNNLDKPNPKYNTYSFNLDDPFLHRGLYFYYIQPEADAPDIYELIFEYNNKTKDLNLYIMGWIETKQTEAIIKEFPTLEAARYPAYITKDARDKANILYKTEKTINDYNKIYAEFKTKEGKTETRPYYEEIIRPYEFILPYKCYDDYIIKGDELKGVLKEYQDLVNKN